MRWWWWWWQWWRSLWWWKDGNEGEDDNWNYGDDDGVNDGDDDGKADRPEDGSCGVELPPWRRNWNQTFSILPISSFAVYSVQHDHHCHHFHHRHHHHHHHHYHHHHDHHHHHKHHRHGVADDLTSALQKATLSASSLAFASVSFFFAFSAFVFVCWTECVILINTWSCWRWG